MSCTGAVAHLDIVVGSQASRRLHGPAFGNVLRGKSGRLVPDYALQRQAWILQDGLAMRDEHDIDRPVEQPTKFLTDPSRSLLLGRPPFRWHPQATLTIAFD